MDSTRASSSKPSRSVELSELDGISGTRLTVTPRVKRPEVDLRRTVFRVADSDRCEKGARVVSSSSRGHIRAGVDFDHPNFERRPYDKWIAYAQSKTATALFAVALDARGEAHRVRAFSVHPGAVMTDLMRSMSDEAVRAAVARSREVSVFKTTEQGAATSVWCATSTQLFCPSAAGSMRGRGTARLKSDDGRNRPGS